MIIKQIYYNMNINNTLFTFTRLMVLALVLSWSTKTQGQDLFINGIAIEEGDTFRICGTNNIQIYNSNNVPIESSIGFDPEAYLMFVEVDTIRIYLVDTCGENESWGENDNQDIEPVCQNMSLICPDNNNLTVTICKKGRYFVAYCPQCPQNSAQYPIMLRNQGDSVNVNVDAFKWFGEPWTIIRIHPWQENGNPLLGDSNRYCSIYAPISINGVCSQAFCIKPQEMCDWTEFFLEKIGNQLNAIPRSTWGNPRYKWSGPGVDGDTNSSISAENPGWYYVEMIDSFDGIICVKKDSVYVETCPNADDIILDSISPVCPGSLSTISGRYPHSGGSIETSIYKLDGGLYLEMYNTQEDSFTYTGLRSGDTYLIVSRGANGCEKTQSVTIPIVTNLPSIQVNYFTDDTLCRDEGFQLAVHPTGGTPPYSYHVVGLSNVGSGPNVRFYAAPWPNGLEPGVYTYTAYVIDANGCKSNTIEGQWTVLENDPDGIRPFMNQPIQDPQMSRKWYFSATYLPGATYEWDFGDGKSATGLQVTHIYDNCMPNKRLVSLTTTTKCYVKIDTVTVSYIADINCVVVPPIGGDVLSPFFTNETEEEIEDKSELVVYPNPVKAGEKVVIENLPAGSTVSLLSNIGQIYGIYSGGEIIAPYRPGTYIIRIHESGITQKLIVY
jgi:hypothetical protein